jgi:cytochrome c oxidase cbb3-type subunit 2
LVVAIGGLVEIVPLYFQKSTIEPVAGITPYPPLQLEGRDIYLREGCYNCHSQMIRSLRDEIERYGHYSLAAESMYDHPFQWGSKRTGPDLARVGGKYSDAWHVEHLRDPRSVVPTSIMPGYPFLEKTRLNYDNIADKMKTLQAVGVPYSYQMIADAKTDLLAQVKPDSPDAKALIHRYPKAQVRKFDGQQGDDASPTELDAVVAYLQMLGTLVDFTKFDASGPNLR